MLLVSKLTQLSTPDFKFEMSSVRFSALWSLLTVIFYNKTFFIAAIGLVEDWNFESSFLIVGLTVFLFTLNFIVFLLLIIPWAFRAIFIGIFICAAISQYFMLSYGILIHQTMVQNLVESDTAEISGLLSANLLIEFLLLGVIPSLFILRASIVYKSIGSEIWLRVRYIVLGILILLGILFMNTAGFSSFFREHKNVRQMANPLNFIYASISYVSKNTRPIIIQPLGKDAHLTPLGSSLRKPLLVMLVVGETARADHFSINGYSRPTTPLMANENIINFSSVVSCGTETAVSVPCMMSLLTRKGYSNEKAKRQESVLDILSHAGIGVFWRDNNSSCKGACDRLAYENIQKWKLPELCNDRECFDKALLFELDKKLMAMQSSSGHKLIVLHQKGSHGPDYYHRYPEQEEFFQPVCKTNELQDCSSEEIINAFDNTIRYTDQFLAATIDWLKLRSSDYDTAMVYLSDHGESLGEDHLYLHGMPYLIAPDVQKKVPFLVWLSPGFERDNYVNRQCLRDLSSQDFSQDNLSHTLMGLLNVFSQVYNNQLDIVATCRH
jgi:lipid A ethanolaminephosphotransferase